MNFMSLVVVLALLPTNVVAEVVVCHTADPDAIVKKWFRIEAEKDLPAHVWYAYDAEALLNNPADVLEHYYTGIDGSEGLGISSFMILQPNGSGNPMLPALLAVDWTTNRIAIAYVEIHPGLDLLSAHIGYECRRLD